MKQHIKQYPAKRGFACGGAVKKRGMVDGGVAGRNYPVSLSDSIPAASASGMAALASVANSPAQTAAPPGAPLASVRQFGDFSSQQAQQAGADIPAAAPGSSLGPADQFSWRVMPKTDATQQPAAPQSAQQTMAISAPAATPLLTMAEKDRAAGHNPNGPYRYDQMGNKQWIGETKQTQVANANKFAELVGQPAKTVPFTDPLGETIASSARRARRPVFADGGAVKETAEQMLAKISSKYGLGDTGNGTSPQPTQQAPQPAPAPTQQPVAQGGMMGKTTDAIGRRNDELRRVSNYGDGGMVSRVKDLSRGAAQAIGEFLNVGKPNETVVKQPEARYNDNQILVPREEGRADMPQERKQSFMAETARRGQQMREAMNYGDGGMVRFAGKGGPRDDKIPVKVAGESINVSDGENAVILPAKTAANPQAVGLIGQIIQATNDGRAPKMGMADGGRYEFGSLPVRQVADEIDLIRGRLETANAQAADRASMNAYKAELATRDVMAARAAEGQNMRAALDSAKSQPAINQKALPAQPIYRPNWTAGNNAPVLEGVVETADELRAKAAQPAARAIAAPQPGTAVTPRAVDWTPGGGAPAGGPMQARTVDWTYGHGGGPTQQPGMARSATPAAAPLSITGPQEAIKADPRTMARTAAAARASGGMSPEAAAFDASRTQTTAPSAEAAKQTSKLSGMAGKAAKILAPVAKFATVADIAANAYNSGRDGGAIQIEPSEQQMRDYQTQGGMARFASAAKHGLTAGALNVADAATGVIDSAASLPNLVLPAMAQIPSAQEHYRGLVKETFSPSGAAAAHGTATIRDEKPRGEQTPGMVQAAIGNEGRSGAILNGVSPAAAEASAALRNSIGNGGIFDPTQQRFANGTGAMTSTKTGKTMVVTPGSYTAADGSETDDWSKTQAYADAIRRNQADKVRLAEMQAERLGGNPQDILQKSQGMAQAAAESSLNQQAKRQAIETGQVSLEQAQQLQSLGQLMTEGKTPEVRAEAARAYHVMTGKGRDAPQEQYDNIVVKDYDQNGMVVGEHIEQRPKNRSVAAMPAAQQYEVKAGMSVTAPDGVHTFQGKTITVKAGKVVEVK